MPNDLPPPQKKSNQTLLWLIGGVSCGIVIIGLFILLFRFNDKPLPFSFNKLINNPAPSNALEAKITPPAGAIIRVGNEFIYQQDLTTEMNYAPGNDPQKEQLLEKKLVQDSILLQGAEADKLVKLDNSVFNSPNKDYLKRIEVIRNVEKLIESKTEKISGTVITIWFFNNDRYGPLGPDKSKELAHQKVNEYYQLVLKKQISIDQALERIKTDKSLDQLGEHKNNAGYTFDTSTGEEPSFDENFNMIIHQLQPGQLSPVTVIKDKFIPAKPLEALYAFALVKNKTEGGKFSNYNDWLKAKKKEYAVMYY